jgi:hypothetical protein
MLRQREEARLGLGSQLGEVRTGLPLAAGGDGSKTAEVCIALEAAPTPKVERGVPGGLGTPVRI